MKLFSSLTSPYGRKVRIALALLQIDVERLEAQLADPEDPLRQANPLGKMPCLVLDDGTAVFDSPVILEYLDMELGGTLLPASGAERLAALTLQALADGITDAAVLMSSERFFRPAEHVSERWQAHQLGKVTRGLSAIAVSPPDPNETNVGTVSLACALGYLDWRKPIDWRAEYASLVEWLDAFRAVHPAYDATATPI